MLPAQYQIPELMQCANNYLFAKNKRISRYEYPLHIQQKFLQLYEEQPYHNPFMAYCIKYGLFHNSTRYMSLCKYAGRPWYTEVVRMNEKNITYNPLRNKELKFDVRLYYPPFIMYLFLNDKLEDYVREYAEMTANWIQRERNNMSFPEKTKESLKSSAAQDTWHREDDKAVWHSVSSWLNSDLHWGEVLQDGKRTDLWQDLFDAWATPSS